MPVQLSPGVVTNEYDLTGIIPTVSTTTGALAGIFNWGPVNKLQLIGSQSQYANVFGTPTNLNPETWFTGWNFLSYGNTMIVARAANTTGATPFATFYSNSTGGSVSNTFILSSGNTNNLSNGMYVSQVSNANIVGVTGNNITLTVVNSIAIALNGVTTTSNTALNLYFANPGTTYNALATQYPNVPIANLVNQVVSNSSVYYNIAANNFDTNVLYVARYPGAKGNSLKVSVCDSATAYQSNIALTGFGNTTVISNTASGGNNYTGTITTAIGVNTAVVLISSANAAVANSVTNVLQQDISLTDNILVGNSTIGYQYLEVTAISNVTSNSTASTFTIQFQQPYGLHTPYVSNTVQRYWEYYNTVGIAPGQSNWVQVNGNTAANDELHVVVVDENGAFTGIPGSILETYKNVSRAEDAENMDGTDNYYVNIINQNSQYIWWANDRSGAASANAALVSSSTNLAPGSYSLILGSDGYSEVNAPLSILGSAYSLFANKENVTIDLIMQGHPSGVGGPSYQLANYIISNVVLQRKDCVFFISPDKTNVINNLNNEALSIVSWASNITDTSYAVIDTGYKYQYDQFNNLYRWIPLNGDIAGLCARTDSTNNPWWSPAGFNRGQINNLVKLAYNPGQTDRDYLFVNYINPVVTFPGRGTILFGDITYLGQDTAFSRINVRRLFIVLERAISLAAQNYLFEFNDTFTRAQFTNMVNPYLRTIQGLRGITDFIVICDATNNTPAIIDANKFVGDIYIKPARSIDFITLNFIAVPTGVEFAQVIGSY